MCNENGPAGLHESCDRVCAAPGHARLTAALSHGTGLRGLRSRSNSGLTSCSARCMGWLAPSPYMLYEPGEMAAIKILYSRGKQ